MPERPSMTSRRPAPAPHAAIISSTRDSSNSRSSKAARSANFRMPPTKHTEGQFPTLGLQISDPAHDDAVLLVWDPCAIR